jgi:hypothetical protein
MMTGAVREVLLGIRTVAEMVEAFRDEEECRRLLEVMVWPRHRQLVRSVSGMQATGIGD